MCMAVMYVNGRNVEIDRGGWRKKERGGEERKKEVGAYLFYAATYTAFFYA